MNYLVGDIVIRLKNASLARRKTVYMPKAKIVRSIAEVLMKEGYLSQVSDETVDGKAMVACDIVYNNRMPLFTDVRIISKPSLRIYRSSKEVKGRGIRMNILSTSKGIMTGKEAFEKRLGGEVLFQIW